MAQVSLAFFHNLHTTLIRCSKFRSLILRRDVETHTSYQRHNFHTTNTDALKSQNWCELKHAQTCLYYDQVAWLP